MQEYVNKKSATEIGDEAVTQKKKSSELPKARHSGAVMFRRLDDREQSREPSLMSSRFH